MTISFPARALILAFVALATLSVTACGTLPREVERPTSSALAPAADRPLVRIAGASLPAPELTGFG